MLTIIARSSPFEPESTARGTRDVKNCTGSVKKFRASDGTPFLKSWIIFSKELIISRPFIL